MSIVFRLLFGLPQPGEEGRDGLEGHAFARLLGGVFARLPPVESVLGDDVLVVETVKEHPEEVWRWRKSRMEVEEAEKGGAELTSPRAS